MYKVGVTGGIGGGKSTLCRCFADMGVPLYNSDQRAKELMVSSGELRSKIIELFGDRAYLDGVLNRAYLAEQIFNNPELRESLNAIVHPAVRVDFVEWAESQVGAPYVMMETAILFGAGLDKFVDTSVAVLAPEQLRVERAMSRDNITEEQVRARMATQLSDEELHQLAEYTVVNIFQEDLEGSAKRLDQIFKSKSKANG
ncbi:MAG: dephospho-CoA kinase [Rikenellaceae bacterium]